MTAQATAPPITVSAALFDELASGFGSAAAVGELTGAQASVDRALLAAAGSMLAERSAVAAEAWRLLLDLDAAHPQAVADTIGHPFFQPWATGVIEAPINARPDVLVGYALAAAVHAGMAADLPVPPGVESLYLPGVGEIAAVAGRVAVEEGGGTRPAIARARFLGRGGPRVLLEDLDDRRGVFGLPPAGRLPEDGFARWDAAHGAAWRLIEERYPRYAEGLSGGLRAIVPLEPAPDGRAVSATARRAFGAVAVALPPTPDTLALLLMHEFQHVKLGALLDLFDLCDTSDTRLFYAPWREDPRPLEGLLQGAYAHLAVVDYWRVRRHHVAGGGRAAAEVQFARWRMDTVEAVEQLEKSGSLTALGQRFAEAMGSTLEGWQGEHVEAAALDAARRAADEHRAAHYRQPVAPR